MTQNLTSTNDEAKEWVDNLKKMCDKKFETIEI